MATVKLQNGKVILKDGKVSCECCGGICDLNLDSTGGNAGYFQSFPVNTGEVGFNITLRFRTLTVRDQLIISTDQGQILYDSGCVRTGDSFITSTVGIPPNTNNVTVRVVPLCDGGTFTIWTLIISCLDETPAP